MTNSVETNLQVVQNKGLFVKIASFFRKIFSKDKTRDISQGDIEYKNTSKPVFDLVNDESGDTDITKLLKIQNELERIGINEENVYRLTKDLTAKQKRKLELLYENQIKKLETSIDSYKNKIILMRQKLGKEN